MYYLHTKKGLAHLDIKPDNFVIRDDFLLSMIDFAHSKRLESQVNYVTCTKKYAPPEVAHAAQIPHQAAPVDIFCFGVTLFILIFQNPPFY